VRGAKPPDRPAISCHVIQSLNFKCGIHWPSVPASQLAQPIFELLIICCAPSHDGQAVPSGGERGQESTLKLLQASPYRPAPTAGQSTAAATSSQPPHVCLPWVACQKQPPSEAALLQDVKNAYRWVRHPCTASTGSSARLHAMPKPHGIALAIAECVVCNASRISCVLCHAKGVAVQQFKRGLWLMWACPPWLAPQPAMTLCLRTSPPVLWMCEPCPHAHRKQQRAIACAL
jgi:hypothetical protein